MFFPATSEAYAAHFRFILSKRIHAIMTELVHSISGVSDISYSSIDPDTSLSFTGQLNPRAE
jgi:hypothetical protein